jgi:hypothetical protein
VNLIKSVLFIFILFLSRILQAQSLFEVGDFEYSIKPGYSSSYLCLKDGPLVNEKYCVESSAFFKEKESMSLAERFDKTRTLLFDKNPSVSTVIPLFSFFKSVGYNPDAEYWEGKCHQWAAAANDDKIKTLLEKVDKEQGIMCGEQIYTPGDLRELITASYRSRHQSFHGDRANKKSLHLELNHLMREQFFGEDDFPPHVFHEVLSSHLKKNQGGVLDLDPKIQVWNHPVFQMKGFITSLDLKEIPLLYISRSAISIPEEAKADVHEIDMIMQDMQMILQTKKDSPSTRLHDLMKDKLQSNIVKKHLEVLKNDESQSTLEGDLVYLIYHLKEEIRKHHEAAIANGLTLKEGYKLKGVTTAIKYLTESHFRGGEERPIEIERGYQYVILEQEKPTGETQVLKSFWSEDRPDFLWIPKCETDTCHQEADSYKKMLGHVPQETVLLALQEQRYQHIGLTIALSDLVRMLESSECVGMKTAEDNLRQLDDLIRAGGIDEKEIERLTKEYKRYKDLKLPLTSDMIQYFDTITPPYNWD